MEGFEELYEIETRDANTWAGGYKFLDNYYKDISFTAKGERMVLRLQGNLIVQRLYFSIIDADTGNYKQSFIPLQLYPMNLIMNPDLVGCTLYYKDSKVWFKDAE